MIGTLPIASLLYLLGLFTSLQVCLYGSNFESVAGRRLRLLEINVVSLHRWSLLQERIRRCYAPTDFGLWVAERRENNDLS